MIAIDTNVVVRFLTADDAEQLEAAKRVVANGAIVLQTVVLETVWVLRSRYGYSELLITERLQDFGAIPTVSFERPERFMRATELVSMGMEFADAFHLAGASDYDGFATFDRSLASLAVREGLKNVDLLSRGL